MTKQEEKLLENFIRREVRKSLKEASANNKKVVVKLKPLDMMALERLANALVATSGASTLIYDPATDNFSAY